ncbi:cation diffusion facilitator family transporter [Saccharopolyspora sp. NPDC047091]|uniref:cation diffusion facilitator family transporter n=1 Tax=Saccharopolyspora sp. NPDC047091 TaxID=3155924 RepID=UPI0033DABA2B
MSAGGGTKAILAALAANAGIAVAKFGGFLFTGSSSMLAESVHSVADTSNQGLLLLGKKTSVRRPTAEHPFGYGRDRYFYSFVVALLLFSLGSVFALYEGVHKIQHPEPLSSPLVAVVILLLAIALESYSFTTAIKESRGIKGGLSWWQFIRQAKTPELPVVLLEDAGALLGLVLALGGVGLAVLTGNPVFDGIGTVGIGLLLGVIAVILIVETKSLLIGEGADRSVLDEVVGELRGGRVRRVIHIRTQYLGPDELLIAAKIDLEPSLDVAAVAAEIDAAEARVRAKVPAARLIYLEPDLDRSGDRSADRDRGAVSEPVADSPSETDSEPSIDSPRD